MPTPLEKAPYYFVQFPILTQWAWLWSVPCPTAAQQQGTNSPRRDTTPCTRLYGPFAIFFLLSNIPFLWIHQIFRLPAVRILYFVLTRRERRTRTHVVVSVGYGRVSWCAMGTALIFALVAAHSAPLYAAQPPSRRPPRYPMSRVGGRGCRCLASVFMLTGLKSTGPKRCEYVRRAC